MVSRYGWTPTNIDVWQQDIDHVVGVDGLSSLLRQYLPGDTCVCLNLFHSTVKPLPQGRDLYVLGYWFEVFDEKWFLELYHANPQAQFLILTNLDACDLQRPRVTVIRVLHYSYFVGPGLRTKWHEPADRSWVVSSLSRRITEYRTFVTAKLLEQPRALVRWNSPIDAHDPILQPSGWPQRDSLLPRIRERLVYQINPEKFENDFGLNHLQYSWHPAFRDSMINSTGESKDISWTPEFGHSPRPYTSEKTWKCLLAGTAMIFSQQPGIVDHLQDLGFEFNYPWSNDYTRELGDWARLDRILDTLDAIMSMDPDVIAAGIRDSCRHNQSLAGSDSIIQRIRQQNHQALEQIKSFLK